MERCLTKSDYDNGNTNEYADVDNHLLKSLFGIGEDVNAQIIGDGGNGIHLIDHNYFLNCDKDEQLSQLPTEGSSYVTLQGELPMGESSQMTLQDDIFSATVLNFIPSDLGPVVERYFTCNLCGSKFFQLLEFQEHMQEHGKKYTYVCYHCSKIFHVKKELQKHAKYHENNSYICRHCSKRFARRSHLSAHLKIHPPYGCTYCGKCFTAVRRLAFHMRGHTGKKYYVCQFCDEMFENISLMKFHMRIHMTNLPYRCDNCNEGFILKGHLKKHTCTIFKKKRLRRCYKKKKDSYKQEHICNEEEKPQHICDICNVILSAVSDFDKHMRRHMAEKLFMNDNPLTKNTITPGPSEPDLSNALANVQTRIKPERVCSDCEVCVEGFLSPYDLEQHLDSHSW